MQNNESALKHFELLVELVGALNSVPAQALEHSYSYESFGSWWLICRYNGLKFRILFDGKDGCLDLQRQAAGENDWDVVSSKQISYPGVDDILTFIKSLV